ncbi:MAG: hypothetical protein V4724_11460 [Pseudomonadota bacterium]
MKPNYTPSGMTYEPGGITERNDYLDAMCNALLAPAEQAFRQAIVRQTATESAQALAGEAQAALRGILGELRDESVLDEELQHVSTVLTAALMDGPPPDPGANLAWIRTRSRDLARALGGFWVNLADSDRLRRIACANLLSEPASPVNSEQRRQWALIYSRFFLTQDEARALMTCLNQYVPRAADMQSVRQDKHAYREVPGNTGSQAVLAGHWHFIHSGNR